MKGTEIESLTRVLHDLEAKRDEVQRKIDALVTLQAMAENGELDDLSGALEGFGVTDPERS